MPCHPPQGRRLEQHVGVGDHDGLGPILGQDLTDPVVERVGLSLAALLASQVEHGTGILRHLGAHDLGRAVGAGVVDDVEAPRTDRIVDVHQRIDAGAQHVGLVPGRQHEGDARRVVFTLRIVVPTAMKSDQQELRERRQGRHHSQQHEDQAEENHGVDHEILLSRCIRRRARLSPVQVSEHGL